MILLTVCLYVDDISEAQGLVFHKGWVNMGSIFSKVWTWVRFGHGEDAWKIVIPIVKVQDCIIFCVCNLPTEKDKQINRWVCDCLEPLRWANIPNWAKQPIFVAIRVIYIEKRISNKILISWWKKNFPQA